MGRAERPIAICDTDPDSDSDSDAPIFWERQRECSIWIGNSRNYALTTAYRLDIDTHRP